MSVDHLQRYGKPRKPPALGECFEASDQPTRFIEFRDRGNNTVTVQYSTLSVVTCNPSTAITLRFGELKITIRGRNFSPLVPLFSEHRITLCKEMDDQSDTGDESMTFVTKIEFPNSISPTGEGKVSPTGEGKVSPPGRKKKGSGSLFGHDA